MEIFHKIELVENWGTGFQRIIKECEKNGNELPNFSEKVGAFVVAFNKRKENVPEKLGEKLGERLGERLGEKLGEKRIKMIELIKINRGITINEMAKEVGISETAIENNLVKLREFGVIRRVGPDKGGYWEVL